MKVWIVAKLHRGENAWIHGLTEENLNIRLLPLDEASSKQLPFAIGQMWDLSYHRHPKLFSPHIENVMVDSWRFIGEEHDLRGVLMEKVNPWKGSPHQLFNGSLKSGMRKTDIFIAEGTNFPPKSMGYWLPDEPLLRSTKDGFTVYSSYEFLINYAGFARAIPEIAAQALVHVSLNSWWTPPSPTFSYQSSSSNETKIQKRCYLEIGGWYL